MRSQAAAYPPPTGAPFRIALRAIAMLSFAAICGMLALFVYRASIDPAGIRKTWHTVKFPALKGGAAQIGVPDTWTVQSPEAGLPLDQITFLPPIKNCTLKITCTNTVQLNNPPQMPGANLSPEQWEELTLLERTHYFSIARLRQSIPGYKRLAAPSASSIPFGGALVELFTTTGSNESIRGFVYSSFSQDACWTIVGTSPDSHWDRLRPIFAGVVRRLEVQPDTGGRSWP